MRIMWLIPSNRIDGGDEIQILRRDANKIQSSRNETEKSFEADHDNENQPNNDKSHD